VSWRRSIDMSVVLYRDASPRSAILTQCKFDAHWTAAWLSPVASSRAGGARSIWASRTFETQIRDPQFWRHASACRPKAVIASIGKHAIWSTMRVHCSSEQETAVAKGI